MAVGTALTRGYSTSRPADTQRSFMPVINTLGSMIKQSRARQNKRVAIRGGFGSRSEDRAAQRQERDDQEKALAMAEIEHNREVERQRVADIEAKELRANEEQRRDEMHAEKLRQSGQVTADQDKQKKLQARQEAYEQVKQGLMTQDAQMVEDAMRKMMPEAEDPRERDVITYGKTETGERKVTARPAEKEVPKFLFHPDGYVGVTFPGQDKPTVFENTDEAFKNVVAPMNPQRYSDKPGSAKDLVTDRKNVREADYKNRKLQADIHADAHEAAMQQFEADGYYQQALYDEDKYQAAYANYIEKATGSKPRAQQPTAKTRKGAPRQYSGDEPPQGFPDAKRGPRGGWYIMKKGKWHPILEGKESSPAAPQPKPKPRPKQSPNQTPQQTAEDQPDIEAAGVPFGGGRTGSAQGRSALSQTPEFKKKGQGKVYRGKAQPPDYPDAQYDEKERAWFYFDGEAERWRKVRI